MRALVLRAAPLAIVILNPQQHLRAVPARQAPHGVRVQHVAEMQIARGRGCEPGEAPK